MDVFPETAEVKVSELSFERLNRFIGKEIPREKVINILKNLETEVKDNGNLHPYSAYLQGGSEREQDYYEEIIRMYGFDNIENILPKVEINEKAITDTTKFTDVVKLTASSAGALKEVINYSFIPKDGVDKIRFTRIPKERLIDVLKPITEDFVTLRPTLLYSLIKNAKDNMNRNISNIRF